VKKVLYPLKVIWGYWYFFIFILIFLILFPVFKVFLSREKWYPYANRLRVIWGYILFLFTGLILKRQYEEKLSKDRPYIFCANHFSYLDIPVSAMVVRRKWRFMAKIQLSNIPIFSIFFGTLDIAVDRDNRRESFRAQVEAGGSLDRKISIVVYPEGTIGPHPPSLVRFKNGPFRMAIEKQVPIVPLTMPDNWRLLYVNGWKIHGHPGVARAFIHSPIETTGMTMDDVDSLRDQVYRIIDADLKKYATQK
jgi:1-acyl-sn-glycerol-3-phosphate acyltransferase